MIKINLVAVGKVKESYFKEAIAEYSKRLAAFCKFTVIEVKEENFRGESAQIAEKSVKSEGALIMQKLAGYNIALAIEGEKISSEKLAEKIRKLTDGGAGEITFIIGGSYGLSGVFRNDFPSYARKGYRLRADLPRFYHNKRKGIP